MISLGNEGLTLFSEEWRECDLKFKSEREKVQLGNIPGRMDSRAGSPVLVVMPVIVVFTMVTMAGRGL